MSQSIEETSNEFETTKQIIALDPQAPLKEKLKLLKSSLDCQLITDETRERMCRLVESIEKELEG